MSKLKSLLLSLLKGDVSTIVPLLDYLRDTDDYRFPRFRRELGILFVACPTPEELARIVAQEEEMREVDFNTLTQGYPVSRRRYHAFLRNLVEAFWEEFDTLAGFIDRINTAVPENVRQNIYNNNIREILGE